jgi:hypothetical protein
VANIARRVDFEDEHDRGRHDEAETQGRVGWGQSPIDAPFPCHCLFMTPSPRRIARANFGDLGCDYHPMDAAQQP